MPYYNRRRKRYYRRRWFRTWRPRYPVFRRRRWRKRHRVRRKNKTISIRQWQPTTIRKCCIKGIMPLFIANKDSLSRNFRMYEHSIIPELYPGGGGFSITKFSLGALYEQHQYDRNWWTQTNQNLPLIRYTGCKLKLYQSAEVDYVVNTSLCNPMKATCLLYHSCQPSFMMMNKDCVFVPSKLTQKKRKPYKVLKFGPPNELTNKWYFAHDLDSTGLLMMTCAAASFDHYYIATNNRSNNISFVSLNPNFWQRHDFIQPPSEGYSPAIIGTNTKHMWTTKTPIHTDADITSKLKFKNLIYLGTTKENLPGTEYIKNTSQDWNNYFSNHTNWGNPFREEYLTGTDTILISTKPINTLKTTYENSDKQLQPGDFTLPTHSLLVNCRYTPDRDTGVGNKIYLKSTIRDTSGWEPPTKEELVSEGFPLWILCFGFLDWQRKLGEATNITRTYVVVIESHFIDPQLQYYIMLDYNFLHGTSPFANLQENEIKPDDAKNWYPQTLYQTETLEKFVSCGPGVAKLGGRQSVEAKMKYCFYFKFGGCLPKMDTIADPSKFPVYPMPSTEFSPYALQNPALQPEAYLYQFDVYKDFITKAAEKRIKKNWQLRKLLFTDTNRMDAEPHNQEEAETSSSGTEDSEKEEETLLKQLLIQRKKQRRLQHKLLKLMQ
nr:MAG: ORF1 [TTV-like mini virus]